MKTLFSFITLQLLLLSATQIVQAQPPGRQIPGGNPGGGTGGGTTIPNPLNVSSITDLFRSLLEILIIFAVPIIVFFIIYAGFLYVTARGNTEQVGKAHRALLYAVIGGLLVLGANVLIQVIQGTVDAVSR